MTAPESPGAGHGGGPEKAPAAADPFERAKERLAAVPRAMEELREEVRRLRAENANLRKGGRLAALMHVWADLLLDGLLSRKSVLSEIARTLQIKTLTLWRLGDQQELRVEASVGSAPARDLGPCRVGRETAGATWAIGKTRVWPEVSMAPPAVQAVVGGRGKSFLSSPVRSSGGGWVVEAIDHIDGRPLSAAVMDDLPLLVPWVALADAD